MWVWLCIYASNRQVFKKKKCLGNLHVAWIPDFSGEASSPSYHRIHNQHHLGTDHLITHLLFPALLLEHWVPRFSIQTRNCQDYKFHLLRAGIHSHVLVTSHSISVHTVVNKAGGAKKSFPKLEEVKEFGKGTYQK